jgi:hypothetical protein
MKAGTFRTLSGIVRLLQLLVITCLSPPHPIAIIRGRLNVRQVLKIRHGERNDRFFSDCGRNECRDRSRRRKWANVANGPILKVQYEAICIRRNQARGKFAAQTSSSPEPA